MSNYQTINNGLSEAMQSSFEEDMNGLETLETNIYEMAFTSHAGTVYGYKLSPEDYYEIMNNTQAVTHWKVRFGYTKEEINAPIKLILFGSNVDNVQITPNYLLTRGYYEAVNMGCDIPNSIIGHDTGCEWLQKFINHTYAGVITKSAFLLPAGELLRGYTFDAEDFKSPVLELDELQEFYIAFVIHNETPVLSADKFGLLICARGISQGLTETYSHFFDMANTCPPDC